MLPSPEGSTLLGHLGGGGAHSDDTGSCHGAPSSGAWPKHPIALMCPDMEDRTASGDIGRLQGHSGLGSKGSVSDYF